MSGTSETSELEQEHGPPSDPTRSLDVQSIGRVGAVAAWAAALGGGAGSYVLVSAGGRTGLTAGILLGMVALAGLAVALQATGEPWPGEPGYGAPAADAGETESAETATAQERYLPLADRLGLGLVGGTLGGIAVTLGVWLVAAIGLPDLLGVQIAGTLTATSVGLRAWYGALWGLVLALLFSRLPGRSALTRGTLFGLVPALYALLVLYPLVLELGWFGAELGALTFLFVVIFHLLWGVVAGGLFRWAEVTDLGVLSRPLVEGHASEA